MNLSQVTISVLLVISFTACESDNNSKSRKIKSKKRPVSFDLKYSVDKKIPHSTYSFTEGLLIHEGQLYESTGSPDNHPELKSVYGTVNQTTGEIDVHNTLESNYFGEGITILNDKVYQLTYKSREGFVYNLSSREKIKSFTIPTKEGWGLTTDGENLIMSDGTSNLHFIDPKTLEKTGTLRVLNNGRPVNYLNELEYLDGFVYANIFTTDWIVKIDISTGQVVTKLDLTNLKLEEDKIGSQALETNGIAYNPENNKFYVTGKLWKNIYEISIFN